MQKTVSAVLVLVSAVLLSTVSMFGQVTQSIPGGAGTAPKAVSEQDIQMLREDIRTQRKQITAANMTLTSDEATKFWPIYDEYIQETIKINDDRWAMIKDYAANYDTMTDQQAPPAALQASGPPAVPKTAEKIAQSRSFQPSNMSSVRQRSETTAWNGVVK